MLKLNGAARLRQIKVKRQIADRREMRAFMEGRIAWCGAGDEKLDRAIEAEFERVAASAFASGFAAGLASHPTPSRQESKGDGMLSARRGDLPERGLT